MQDSIIADEKALLAQVARYLEENPYEVPPSEKELVAELVRLREELADAKAEDKAAIMAQYDHQYALLQQLRASRDKPTIDPDSPYFAHLKLEENGKTRDLCLGKATRVDKGIRVVDWRNAPISRIFYSYQQGEEYEEDFGGREVEGTVLARRTVTIRRGELQRIDAPEGSYVHDDGGWHEVQRHQPKLAGGQGASQAQLHKMTGGQRAHMGRKGRHHRTDKHLPDIAGLIDPDQFELITRPNKGFLVIRGTAGSGKTTVALHRIAYLSYDDERLNSAQTLFLVFSKALRDYVSHVLPALGIGRVKPHTFPEWAREQRRRHFPILPKRYRTSTPEIVHRMKIHPAIMMALEDQQQLVDGPATMDQAIDDWASVLTQPDVLKKAIDKYAPGAFTDAEIERVTQDGRDRHEELLMWLDRKESGEQVDMPELDREDDALLLRAWQLRVGPLRFQGKRPLRYKHVVIDEVQDFSPIEVRVIIDCLDQNQSITLAGDTQQHVMKDAGFTSWAGFFDWLGVQGTAVQTLQVAYRSSHQIVSFALDLLGDLREDKTPPMTVRDGPPVEVFSFTDAGAVVGFLADTLEEVLRNEPSANVALVSPDIATSEMYYQGLRRANVPSVRRVIGEEFSFTPGIDIVEVEHVKGLEFDYVILIEPNAGHFPDTPAARRMLHVAATRAIHQLWMVHVGTLSPIIRGALEEGQGQHEA